MENTDRLSHIEPVAYFLPEFCKKFCVSRTSLYREINAKRLRLFKRGKRSLIERVEAERWFNNLTNHPKRMPSEGDSSAD